MASERHSNPEEAGVTNPTTPVQTAGESQWIMNAVNGLDRRIGENFTVLSESIDKNASRYDDRLRKVEDSISSFKGSLRILGIVLVIVQILALLAYRYLDISLRTPP